MAKKIVFEKAHLDMYEKLEKENDRLKREIYVMQSADYLVKQIAIFFGITTDQVLELRRRIQAVVDSMDGGFGNVWMEFRRGALFRLSHKLDGKPTTFKDGE